MNRVHSEPVRVLDVRSCGRADLLTGETGICLPYRVGQCEAAANASATWPTAQNGEGRSIEHVAQWLHVKPDGNL